MSTVTTKFSKEKIPEWSMENAKALCLASMCFAKENGLSPAQFWASIGKQYARGWESMKGKPLTEVANHIALNVVSVGGTLLSITGDESTATTVFKDWPSEGLLTFFGLSQAEADETWSIFGPITESLGLSYQWRREGDQVMATVMRQEQG